MESLVPSPLTQAATAPAVMAFCVGLFSPLAVADDLDTALSFTTDFLSVEVRGEDGSAPREARFSSGLGLQLRNQLLQFSVDYKAQSQLSESSDEAAVFQQVGASLHSSALNQLLGLDADIKADSTFRDGGEAYVHSFSPGFSKSLAELGKLSVQYVRRLDKAGAEALEKEKQGYRMGLEGSTLGGRLSWRGDYRSTDVFGGIEPLQRTELLAFESRYQLVPALQLQVFGFSKDEALFDGGVENDLYTETRYGLGLDWSPSSYYSLTFKMNKLDESSEKSNELFGSGVVSWFPQRSLEFNFSYGEHLIKGERGVMFSTKINLSGS